MKRRDGAPRCSRDAAAEVATLFLLALEVRLRAAHARRLEGGPEAHLVQESLHRAVRLRRYLAAAPQART